MATHKTFATLPLPLQFLAAWLAVWLGRVLQEQVDYLKAENHLLREKLAPKRVMLTDAERRKLAMLGKALGRKGLTVVATIASPETILRWYRELVAKKYDGSQQRRQGRPKTAADIAALIVRMAKDNDRWGYTRIMGALKNLGHEIGRNTIKRKGRLFRLGSCYRHVPLGEAEYQSRRVHKWTRLEHFTPPAAEPLARDRKGLAVRPWT